MDRAFLDSEGALLHSLPKSEGAMAPLAPWYLHPCILIRTIPSYAPICWPHLKPNWCVGAPGQKYIWCAHGLLCRLAFMQVMRDGERSMIFSKAFRYKKLMYWIPIFLADHTKVLANFARIMLRSHSRCTLMMAMQRLSLFLMEKQLAVALHFIISWDPQRLILLVGVHHQHIARKVLWHYLLVEKPLYFSLALCVPEPFNWLSPKIWFSVTSLEQIYIQKYQH